MEINCNNSNLNSIYCHCNFEVRYIVQRLWHLLNNSSFYESKTKYIVALLKQIKDNVAHCDRSDQELVEKDSFQNTEELESSANIDVIIKKAESFIDMFTTDSLDAQFAKYFFPNLEKSTVDIDTLIKQGELLLDILANEDLYAKFNGEIVDWFQFWDSFESEIHKREDLQSDLKFTCLKHRLEGWPLNMVTKLGSGDCAYNEALKLLKATFRNKKILIESHLNALIDLEPPTATPISLKRFNLDFEYHIKALKSYGISIEEAGFFVVAILNKKLPKEIWININKADRTSYWTLPEFQNALKFEVQQLNFEIAQQENSHFTVESQNVTPLTVEDTSACKGKAERVQNHQDSSKYSLICQLCSGCHHFSGCTAYKTSFQKLERSKQLNLCSICIKNDHDTENCLKSVVCAFCQGKHNSLLCLNETRLKENNNNNKKESLTNPVMNLQENLFCPLCNDKHQFGVCKKFETPLKKHGKAILLNLCLLCLKDTHKTSDCLKNNFCKWCGEKHNSLLCLCPASKQTQKSKKKRKRSKKKKASSISIENVVPPVQNTKKATGYAESGSWRSFMTTEKQKLSNYIPNGNTVPPVQGTKKSSGSWRSFITTKKQIKNISSGNVVPPVQGVKKKKKVTSVVVSENWKSFMTNMTTEKQMQATKISTGNIIPPVQGAKKAASNIQIGNLGPFMTNRVHTVNVKPYNQVNTHIPISQIKTTNLPSQDAESELVTCTLCDNNHHFAVCSKYKTSVDKRVRAVQLKLCLICVNNKHITSLCLKLQVCKYCNARHHTLLCIESEHAIKTNVYESKAKRHRLRKKARKEREKKKEKLLLKALDQFLIL